MENLQPPVELLPTHSDLLSRIASMSYTLGSTKSAGLVKIQDIKELLDDAYDKLSQYSVKQDVPKLHQTSFNAYNTPPPSGDGFTTPIGQINHFDNDELYITSPIEIDF